MKQNVVKWDIGNSTLEAGPLHLNSLSFQDTRVILALEVTDRVWELVFSPQQAFRFTTEHCVWNYREAQGLYPLKEGTLFEIMNSEWIQSLGKGEVHFLEQSRHFMIDSRDGLIEVIAHGCTVSPAT